MLDVLAPVILSNSKVHISLLDYSSMLPKVEWVINESSAFRVSLGVPDINLGY